MWRRLLRRDDGTTMVEFSIVMVLLIALLFGILEIGWALAQWNAANKATHLGVRAAVVSDPVAPGLRGFSGLTKTNHPGTPCLSATGVANPDCQLNPDPLICDQVGCSSSTYGYSAEAFGAVVAAMQRAMPRIAPENVVIEYRTSWIGFVGRPGGIPVLVTVRLRGMSFDFAILNAMAGLLDGDDIPASMPMPAAAATLTSEDFRT